MNELSSSILPTDFFKWWLNNQEKHNLKDEYELLYPNYAKDPEAIPYVWNHYNRRFLNLNKLDLKGKRILDIGCGLGTEIFWCALQGAVCEGIELHSMSYNIAKRRLGILKTACPWIKCDINYKNLLSLDQESYDIIFLRETFHHLEPREEIVKKIDSLLAKNGAIIMEETNGWNPVLQLKYYKIRGSNTIVTKRDPESGSVYTFGNERITTPSNIIRLFDKYNYKYSYNYFRFLPTKLAKFKSFAKIVEVFEPILVKTRILNFMTLHYSLVLEKK